MKIFILGFMSMLITNCASNIVVDVKIINEGKPVSGAKIKVSSTASGHLPVIAESSVTNINGDATFNKPMKFNKYNIFTVYLMTDDDKYRFIYDNLIFVRGEKTIFDLSKSRIIKNKSLE